MAIKPLGDRVLVELKKAETKTAGGIYIPESSDNEKKQGVIVELGNGEKVSKSGLKKGDQVFFDSYSGNEIKENDKKYLVIDVKDILAKLD